MHLVSHEFYLCSMHLVSHECIHWRVPVILLMAIWWSCSQYDYHLVWCYRMELCDHLRWKGSWSTTQVLRISDSQTQPQLFGLCYRDYALDQGVYRETKIDVKSQYILSLWIGIEINLHSSHEQYRSMASIVRHIIS